MGELLVSGRVYLSIYLSYSNTYTLRRQPNSLNFPLSSHLLLYPGSLPLQPWSLEKDLLKSSLHCFFKLLNLFQDVVEGAKKGKLHLAGLKNSMMKKKHLTFSPGGPGECKLQLRGTQDSHKMGYLEDHPS